MSQFQFLEPEWPARFDAAKRAEALARSDPRTACFQARRAPELAVRWLYKHDPALRLPYQEHLGALIHEPTFRELVGSAIFAKTRMVKDFGNLAVHRRPARRPRLLRGRHARPLYRLGYQSSDRKRVHRSGSARRIALHGLQPARN